MTRIVVTLLCLGAVVAAVVLWADPLLERVGVSGAVLPWTEACSVQDGDTSFALSLDQAQRATTAVALESRDDVEGVEVDVEDVETGALDLLRDGPADDPGPALTCSVSGSDDLVAEDLNDSGLTPRAENVLEEMRDVFGELSVGGFEPGGVDQGHGESSAHYQGRAVDVFFRPVSEDNRRTGWILAHWLVAHAGDLDVDVIIFDDRIFSARLPQWRDYQAADPDDEVLRHLDHVHVDVRRGSGD